MKNTQGIVMLTRNRLIQLFIMLALLIGLFIWRTVDFEVNNQDKINLATGDNRAKNCQLSEPCVYETDFGDFTLIIQEGKVVPEEWYHLTLESQTKNWTIKSAQVISEKGFIGKIPVDLVLVSTEKSNGITRYNAKSMVGACSEKNVLLELQVNLLIAGKETSIAYQFFVSN